MNDDDVRRMLGKYPLNYPSEILDSESGKYQTHVVFSGRHQGKSAEEIMRLTIENAELRERITLLEGGARADQDRIAEVYEKLDAAIEYARMCEEDDFPPEKILVFCPASVNCADCRREWFVERVPEGKDGG